MIPVGGHEAAWLVTEISISVLSHRPLECTDAPPQTITERVVVGMLVDVHVRSGSSGEDKLYRRDVARKEKLWNSTALHMKDSEERLCAEGFCAGR